MLRGTTWIVTDRSAFLWTNGFQSHLLTYDGWMVPAPLRIDIQHGAADVEAASSDASQVKAELRCPGKPALPWSVTGDRLGPTS